MSHDTAPPADPTLAPERPAPPRLTGLRALSVALVICGGAPTLLGLAGGMWWLFDIFAHFRVQFVVMLLPALVLALLRRQRWVAAAGGALLVLNLALVLPPCFGSAATGAPALTLISANVHSSNTDYARLLQLVNRERPDVVVVLEVSDAWAASLEEGLPEYATRLIHPRPDNFGIAFLSKLPAHADIVELGDDLPSIVAHVTARDGRELTLIGTHPIPPGGASKAARRDAQLTAVGELAARAGPATVVAGDLNATPWSTGFRILEGHGLSDTRAGFGVQTTWPVDFFPLAIPIDHCLVGPSLGAVRREVLDDIGSDHYPILIDLVWRD